MKDFITKIKQNRTPQGYIEMILSDCEVFEYTLRHTNRLLQIGAKEIGIRKKNISTHSLRKSGARFIWEEFNKSDESLIKLSMVLNHSSSAITRRYLGITKEEIADIYEGFNFNL